MTEPRIETTIRLADGRRLAFAEYGDPEGKPVMLFHGLPGSRLAWGLLPGDPPPTDLRIIAPDRSGYGNSDAKPGRTLLEWAMMSPPLQTVWSSIGSALSPILVQQRFHAAFVNGRLVAVERVS